MSIMNFRQTQLLVIMLLHTLSFYLHDLIHLLVGFFLLQMPHIG